MTSVVSVIEPTQPEASDAASAEEAQGQTLVVPMPNLTVEFLTALHPSIVITPLTSPSFDCVDVAKRLLLAEFTGQLRVLTGTLPRPEIVVEELRRSFPSLDVDIWIVPQGVSTLEGGV